MDQPMSEVSQSRDSDSDADAECPCDRWCSRNEEAKNNLRSIKKLKDIVNTLLFQTKKEISK